MSYTSAILPGFDERVDEVLKRLYWREWIYALLLAALFLTGIAGLGSAVIQGEYLWSVPSALVAFFLKWPLAQIWRLRKETIALCLAPALIRELPEAKAAARIEQMLDNLFPHA